MDLDDITGETDFQEVMGEAILLQERVASTIHHRQQVAELEKAPFQTKVSSMIRLMNQELSIPDEYKDNFLAQHTKDLLRNSALKSQLATYLAVQAQLERLSVLIQTVGDVDNRLSSPDVISEMTPNQLIFLQKSLHQQIADISAFIEKQKLEGLDTLLNTIAPDQDIGIRETVKGISNMTPSSREKVNHVIAMLIEKIGTQDKIINTTDGDSSAKI